MFALRMIQLIENHATKLSDELLNRLETSGDCTDLIKNVPANELRMRTHEIYRNLSDWLLSKTPSEIEERYRALGMRRAKQGVPFSELLYAFSLTKECLWSYLEQNGLLEDPMELLGDLNLLHSIGRFFDRVGHAAAVGYELVQQQFVHPKPRYFRTREGDCLTSDMCGVDPPTKYNSFDSIGPLPGRGRGLQLALG